MVLTYSLLNIAMCIQYIDTPPRHELKQGASGARYSLKHTVGKSSGPPWIFFVDFFFFLSSWGLTNLFFEIPGFSKALPSSCPKRGCLLLIMTSSLCPADLHGTRLSTKIKTERPYFSQQQGVFQVGFTHMGGEGGGMSCSVLLSIHLPAVYLFTLPLPKFTVLGTGTTWLGDKCVSPLAGIGLRTATLAGLRLLGLRAICLAMSSQKVRLPAWREGNGACRVSPCLSGVSRWNPVG